MDTMLALIDHPLDGDSWEQIINSCYKMHYDNDHYTEIPALYKGDAGIEGFTVTGVVTQCYFPEKQYTDDELFEHQRDKMTADIKKLLSNGERLKSLGIRDINEWHFVIPEYKDSRIIEHAEKKRLEVIKAKSDDPEQYDYISDSFRVLVKTAENYRVEFTKLIRGSLTEIKLNLDLRKERPINWNDCPSEKIDNIKRKVKAIMGEVEGDRKADYNEVVQLYVTAYLEGIELMKYLREFYADVYEDIVTLEQAYKKHVSAKTKLNTDKSINRHLFNEILSDFQERIEKDFEYITTPSLMNLKSEIISSWLADCSMEFRG